MGHRICVTICYSRSDSFGPISFTDSDVMKLINDLVRADTMTMTVTATTTRRIARKLHERQRR